MTWLQQIDLRQFLIFTLVLTRVSGLMVIAPFFGSVSIPVRVRAFIAFALAVLITPTQLDVPITFPQNLIDYSIFIGGELLAGITLGMGTLILFAGIQVGGQIIATVGGSALANVLDPSSGTSVPVMAQFLFLFTLALFLIIGGHRMVMDALLSTFVTVPPGTAGLDSTIAQTLSQLIGQSFVLAMRTAAPTVTALLLSTLVLGLISRTMPQLNILAVGFGLNSLVTMGTTAVTLGVVGWLFQNDLEPALESLLNAVNSMRGAIPQG
jgi:flagellar biosynthetic protein FliR